MKIKPLYSTFDLTALTKFQVFMRDFPVIGTNDKIRKSLTNQLKLREKFPFEAWSEFSSINYIFGFSQKIAEANAWPNNYFLPEDSIDLLFYPYDDGLEIAEICVEWEDKNGRSIVFNKNIPYKSLFENSK